MQFIGSGGHYFTPAHSGPPHPPVNSVNQFNIVNQVNSINHSDSLNHVISANSVNGVNSVNSANSANSYNIYSGLAIKQKGLVNIINTNSSGNS